MIKLLGYLFSLVMFQTITINGTAQQKKQYQITIPVERNVAWWSGIINHGEKMPLQNGYHANLNDNYGNQVQPLLLSNNGDVIWSEQPFEISLENDTLNVLSPDSSLIYTKAWTTLRDGFKCL